MQQTNNKSVLLPFVEPSNSVLEETSASLQSSVQHAPDDDEPDRLEQSVEGNLAENEPSNQGKLFLVNVETIDLTT